MPVHSNRLQAPPWSFFYISQTTSTTFSRLAASGTYSRQTRLQRTSTKELFLQSYSFPYDWYFLRRCFLFFKFSFFHFRLLETFCCRPPSGRGAQSLRDEGLPTDLAPLHSVGLSVAFTFACFRYWLSSICVRSMESWKPLQRHSTGHLQYRVLQHLFLYVAFVFPGYVSEVAAGFSLEGHTGLFFGARFGCVYWLFLDFFFQVTARALSVPKKY